ncbi:universal stress protein [Pseudonocardia lacus]|uniref:universal stress protein n=1 Tax=Pseudonocardia lacus TaxID=2835865 RepID=UPI0038B6A929
MRPPTPRSSPGGTDQLLVRRAAGARLLVVGSYGEAAWSGMLAGRTGLTLIERAPCPVAVVRGKAPLVSPPRRGPVVVGVDGSRASVRALVLGADLAAATGAELLAVHAFTDVSEAGGAPRPAAPPTGATSSGPGWSPRPGPSSTTRWRGPSTTARRCGSTAGSRPARPCAC